MNKNQAYDMLSQFADNHRDTRIICDFIYDRKTFFSFGIINFFRVYSAVQKLRAGMPVSKIIGKKWFYGMEFETNKHTLCPRPDSETLIEAVLKENPHFFKSCCPQHVQALRGPRILDLGTGTGCLVISLVNNIPNATGVGVDVSNGAIRTARRNVARHNLSDYIKIAKGDFTKPLTSYLLPLTFDIIVSNPPYIAHGDVRVNTAAHHDPELALYAGNDGLAAYRAIAETAKPLLKRGGKIYLEIGAGQATAVRRIFKSTGWTPLSTHKDLSGKIRVLVFEK
ncbi:MAG: peptide chain release factor N(5)-glutamine methyltransferase [Alphaproteobacteria bacterium]|nr:peptide chain release factor N(5)-glutamine methyltransferase [Alphaproteobacteria bacterium]